MRDDFSSAGWEWIWSTYVSNLKSLGAAITKLRMAGQKQKMGWFGILGGHSWSQAMSAFDTAHTISYPTLTETKKCGYLVTFSRYSMLCRKSPILTYPTCTEVIRWNFAKIFGIRKLEFLSESPYCLRDPMFTCFSRTPTCDRQTDTNTQTDTGPWHIVFLFSTF